MSQACHWCGCTEKKACIQVMADGTWRTCSWVSPVDGKPTCSACSYPDPTKNAPAGAHRLYGYVARPRGLRVYGPAAEAKTKELLERLVTKTRTIDRVRRELRKSAGLAAPPLALRLLELADSLDKRVKAFSPRNKKGSAP